MVFTPMYWSDNELPTFNILAQLCLTPFDELNDHNNNMTSHSVNWDGHTTLIYLPSSQVQRSLSILVHCIDATMSSFHKELDNLHVTIPNEDKYDKKES